MKRILVIALSVLMVASLFAGCKGGEGSGSDQKLSEVRFDSFAIGYGKADITPDPASKVMITGNNDHASRLSTSVQEPLWANCIAYTDTDGMTVITFGTDLHGVNKDIVKAVRANVEEATGIPGEYIQFNASHSHSAPHTGTSAVPAVAKSDENIIAKCTEAAIAALEDRAPAKMYLTFVRTENMNFLRHYIKTDGTYVGSGAGDIPDEQLLGHMEAADNQMQLVKFTREGKKDVMIINYQGHPISPTNDEYYTALSSQNIGVMRRVLLEQADTESVYILGACGDVVHGSAIASEIRYAGYKEHGTALAQYIIDAKDTFKEAETGKIHFSTSTLNLGGADYKLDAFGFGDLGWVSTCWENFNTTGLAVKESSPYYMTIFSGLSNGEGSAYMPDAKAMTYDCYEQGPMFTPAGSAEIVEAELIKIIGECFTVSGQTEKGHPEGYEFDHSPKPNGITYQVTSKCYAIPGQNGHYQVALEDNGNLTTVLVETKDLADDILSRSTVKLLFNEQNMVTAIDE